MHTGTNQIYGQAYNQRIVLDMVRLFGPISRADLARRTNLTVQTVSNIVKELIQNELIVTKGRRQGRRGQPAIELELNPSGAYTIGLDLDRDHLIGVLIDLAGNVITRIKYDLDYPTAAETLPHMAEVAKQLIEQHDIPRDKLWGIGVGVPGPIAIHEGNHVHSIANPSNFPGWTDVPVAEILEQVTGLPVYLENNATAAAIGERWYGVGRTISHFFYIYFGMGLGGGMILNGQPYHGVGGNAGELGYIPLEFNDDRHDPDTLLRLGRVFFFPRIYQILKEHGETATNPQDLARLYNEGNPHVLTWFASGVKQLAMVLVSIEFLLDPKAIVFGGKLPPMLIDKLIQQLHQILPSLRISHKPYTPELLPAQVSSDAGAVGVAILPFHKLLDAHPEVMLKKLGDLPKLEAISRYEEVA